MGGEEIHGILAGFENHDLTKFLRQPKGLTDDNAHEQCGERGEDEVERLIADDLLSTT
jgi:hypothetical protein